MGRRHTALTCVCRRAASRRWEGRGRCREGSVTENVRFVTAMYTCHLYLAYRIDYRVHDRVLVVH